MASSNVPKYKLRRWTLFKAFINRQSVKAAIYEHRLKYPNDAIKNNGIVHIGILNLLQKYDVPNGCERAFMRCLSAPEPSDAELIELIATPVRIIDHRSKIVIPADDIIDYQRIRGFEERREASNELEYFEKDQAVYLRVDPYTNKSELKAFIDDYFDIELINLLKQEQTVIGREESTKITNSSKRVRERLPENIKIEEYIHVNKQKTSKQLSEEIKNKFGITYSDVKIRKIKSEIRHGKRTL